MTTTSADPHTIARATDAFSDAWAAVYIDFAAAANSMRQILVNWALASRTKKRGGTELRVEMEDLTVAYSSDPDVNPELDENLTLLAGEDSVAAELVKLRLFAGLSVTEAGKSINLSRTDAYDNWKLARAWFAARLSTPGER